MSPPHEMTSDKIEVKNAREETVLAILEVRKAITSGPTTSH